MESSVYSFWDAAYPDGICVLRPPEGYSKSYRLNKGKSLAAEWPPGVVCKMSPDHPKDIQLADNLYGAAAVVISGRIRDLLVAEEIEEIEYLPLEILNHKGRSASKDYFVLNPTRIVDCIDITASGIRWNAIDKEVISGCRTIVLHNDAIPSGARLFLAKHLTRRILVRDDLVQRLVSTGATGLAFTDPREYTGI